ncbi:MAG: asparagine synthase-related protein [Candidatus Babeliales bacterium]
MAFLLGAFGDFCNSDRIEKLFHIALQQSAEGTLKTMTVGKGIVFAGQKLDEKYHYDQVIPLHANQGLLVGKLFDREKCNAVKFNADYAPLLIDNPQKISDLFWGRYVGVLYNMTSKAITLIRDPQGLSTLFYVQNSDGIIFSTEIELLYKVLEIKPSIDLTYFAEHIINKNQSLPTTPFQGIKELLPGMGLCVTLDGKISQMLLWNISSLKSSFITDENAFEEELLATLKSCTKAWVGDASGVCVELSGGADSSGIMLLLQSLLPDDKKLMAVNYIDSQTQSSNEIEHAQEVADVCNVSLHFLDWQNASLFDKLPHSWRPNKPSSLLLFYNHRKQLQELAWQNNCPEIMNGQGGDHVFLAPPPINALADHWLDHGFNGITTSIKGLSSVYRMPLMPLIYDNAKAVVNYYGKFHASQSSSTLFLNKNFAKTFKQHEFYIKNTLNKFYPAKAIQIESLCQAVAFSERDQFAYNTIITHPLLSQPIVELALKIPTYQSFKDGYDRIFFRRAISRIKKTKSLWRMIKGQTTGTIVKQCAYHAQDIKDIILNGKLVSGGMIDKNWLNKELVQMRHGQAENLWPIIHILTGQLWLNQWEL